jgi:hypothetical protein
VRTEEPNIEKLTTRHGPAQVELRVWLDFALHERILVEAGARGGSASKAVREAMREYFALKDGLTSALGTKSAGETSSPSSEALRSAFSHPIVRMIADHTAQAEKLDSVLQRLGALACMIDQAYQGLVGRIGDVPAQLRARRAAAAVESVQRWRASVVKLFRQSKYTLLDELSNHDHHK